MVQRAESVNGLRIRWTDPPVDQVKMMAGFMDGQTAWILPQAVPPLEITGTVTDIDVPIQIDMSYFANLAGKYQLLDKIGDTINYYPILAIASIAALIAIHCYAIYQILKLKHNGVSIWDTMR